MPASLYRMLTFKQPAFVDTKLITIIYSKEQICCIFRQAA